MTTETTTGSTAMSVDEIRAATAKLAKLRQSMTFVLPLTAAERIEHRSARIGLKKLRNVNNRVVAARQHPELLPPAFDLRRFEEEAALTGALSECLAAIDEMRGAVSDTWLAVGKRAIVGAATVYAHLKVASTTGDRLKRTVEKLASHGGRAPANGTEPSEVPKPEDPAPDVALIPPADKAA